MEQSTNSSKLFGMILFLDDSPERAAKFCSKQNNEEQSRTIWCKTAEEAIITLKDYHDCLSLIFLDHDLGVAEQSFKSSDSGMEVVRFLEENPIIVKSLISNNCRIIVHSWNIVAGKIMVERLRSLGFSVLYRPFGL